MSQPEMRTINVPKKAKILMASSQDLLQVLIGSYLSNIMPDDCTIQLVIVPDENHRDYRYWALITYTRNQDAHFVWNSDNGKWRPR